MKRGRGRERPRREDGKETRKFSWIAMCNKILGMKKGIVA
jgi:hypothetical protein